jgi:hypothetical protein
MGLDGLVEGFVGVIDIGGFERVGVLLGVIDMGGGLLGFK